MVKGIVEYFGPNKTNYPCGYCKANKPDISSYGLWAHEMSTDQYQILIDRTWRRSGKFCYKSILNKICCPTFAIRCEALNFKPSRSQRKVIKRFNNFIYHGIKPKSYEKESRNTQESGSRERESEPQAQRSSSSSKSLESPSNIVDTSTTITPTKIHENSSMEEAKVKDPTKKAKYLRLQRRVDKVALRQNCSKELALERIKEKASKRQQQSTKSFEDYFKKPDNLDKPAHKLEIKFVSTCKDEHIRTFQASHKLYEKYQTHVHQDDPSECTPKQFKRFLIDNPFEAKLFYRGLAHSIPTSYGSYHMQYWLDDELIVVAVLDILSHSVSSVYLFYDPEYSFLSLGTYSALREILLVRDLYKINQSISYYYLGLYIHSCPKMSYKGKFYPSFLLCDQALTWHPIEKCIQRLSHHSYPRFEDDLNKVDEDSVDIKDDDISILYSRRIYNYSVYKVLTKNQDSDEVYEYARLIGKRSTKNILLYRKEENADCSSN
ncbi:arginyl-tRNA--protein transferase 1-like [Panonychus citri]|uniref:arginyl-tRNA--protein transferase 1-like n=1 Tax=Panonychus citri TaxID=50023 RepID=UPI002307D8FA|nr:arginyl-tRNA--protein transferase 1-like [Panonychus citri]